MLILTEKHRISAAKLAILCRQAAGDVRRPAAIMRDNLVMSVGVGESVSFYSQDWNIYTALFTVDDNDRISWYRCNDEFTAKELNEKLERFLNFALEAKTQDRTASSFCHWCSIRCWRTHVRSDLSS